MVYLGFKDISWFWEAEIPLYESVLDFLLEVVWFLPCTYFEIVAVQYVTGCYLLSFFPDPLKNSTNGKEFKRIQINYFLNNSNKKKIELLFSLRLSLLRLHQA